MDHSRLACATAALPPVPPPNPLAMPVQNLRVPDTGGARRRTTRRANDRTLFARLVTFGGAPLLTVLATDQMIKAVAANQVTILQWAMVVLFAFNFAWIALAATSALAGLAGATARTDAAGNPPAPAKTALIMPVYNEDPASTAASLAAMAGGLVESGQAGAFELFVLSDTTEPEIWIRETAVVEELRRSLSGQMAVWYRRRQHNTARKSGNLQEFVERWGGRYQFMVVLDADSLMAAETLVALVDRMQADPALGLLQTVPVLAGGETLLARMQQFAGCIYGPVIARGLAAWQGDDGNYWGHNAIVRLQAFAAACGLPQLPGRKPFGGDILSHDFVEAALMRRAGWVVRMLPELGGSWENCPPSLLDLAARDRRWAQGNLQHVKVLAARGLAWPSRAHFLTGIMSYLAAPLWLALILVGLVLTLQAKLIRPEFFTEEFQLFPTWPEFDAQRMIWLFVLTMGVLLLPKFIGLARALASRRRRRACGGALALVGGGLCEILLSAAYAPISMLLQCRQLWEILIGRDSGWARQRRELISTSWLEVLRRHWLHTLFGALVVALLWRLSPVLLAWMCPTLIGLLLALPMSKLSGSTALGQALRRMNLLRTPEVSEPPPVMVLRQRLEPRFRAAAEGADLGTLLSDERRREVHFHYVLPAVGATRGHPDLEYLAAGAKLADARDPGEAIGWLSRGELLAVLGNRALFEQLLHCGAAPAGNRPAGQPTHPDQVPPLR